MKNWIPEVKCKISFQLDSNFIKNSTKSETCFHFILGVFEIWSSKSNSTEKAHLSLIQLSSNSWSSQAGSFSNSYFSVPQSRMKASLTVLESLWIEW